MDHAATMRRAYDLINAGDIAGFGELVADVFIEHEELPGLEPTKEGVMALFMGYREAFPDLHMTAEDGDEYLMIESGHATCIIQATLNMRRSL